MTNHIPPDEWGASPWVIEECGYALGKNKRVLLLIEAGVNFPKSDIAGDQERIVFNRENLLMCFPQLVSMIGHLVAEKVPQLPATVASQVVTPPEPAATAIRPKGAPTLKEVLELVAKDDFKEADRKYEELTKNSKNEVHKSYLQSRYLCAKAIRGDGESLRALESLCEKNSDTFAWIELAKYHAGFGGHVKAAEILLRGADLAEPEDRSLLIDIAAGYYADKEEYEAAYSALRKLADGKEVIDPTAFISVADTAKRSKNFGLESASLERALELNPADTRTRFRLAYLYGDQNKRHLAMYHYKIQIMQGFDEVAANNLGVSYGELGLTAKEVETLATAKDFPLAVANLAHAYVERGFLDEADSLARQALKSDDEIALKRATFAIERIEEIRQKEEKSEKTLCLSAESEAKVRADYSKAFFESQTRPLNGIFKGEFGTLEISQEGAKLVGNFEGSEMVPGLSLPGVSLPALSLSGAKPVKKTHTIEFKANLRGRCGQYRLESEEKSDGFSAVSILSSNNWKQEGLIIVAEDGTSFQLLNETKTPCELSSGKKIEGT